MGIIKTIYLAGPIKGVDYKDCTDWREYTIKRLAEWGIRGLSPMRGKEYLSLEKKIGDNYDTRVLSCQRGITTRDRFDVMSCDAMLANLLCADNVSIGTIIEYGWADLGRKPVITVIEPEGNVHDHAMLREITGFRVNTLDSGLHVARAVLDRL